MIKLITLPALVLIGATGCTAITGAHSHEDTNAEHAHGQGGMHEHVSDGHMSGGHMSKAHKPMHENMHSGQGMGGEMDHGHHAHAMETLAGKPGKASDVSRTVRVTASDEMRFAPDQPLTFREGEVIRFLVTNQGAIDHEFVIGTKEEHQEHGAMMMSNPGMHHGEMPNAVTVRPGETKEVIWRFENAWQIEVACNIPGHYQAGMHGAVAIED